MNLNYSKLFIKASKKLSGKTLILLHNVINEVKSAEGIEQISDYKKLS